MCPAGGALGSEIAAYAISKKVWGRRCREWLGGEFLAAGAGKNPSSEAGFPGIESRSAVSFSAYVHVPYCLRRCGYCDFNTYANLGLGPGVAGYADAVGREISLVARLFSDRIGSVHEAPAEMAPHEKTSAEVSNGRWIGMAPHAGGVTPTTRETSLVRPNWRGEAWAAPAVQETSLGKTRESPGGRAIDTVFFGGGTPTVLPPEDLVQIFYALKDAFGVCPGAEVTTEANPDTVDAGYLEELAAGGFTRVSFGMQSAVSGVLRVLDRTHTQANLEAAVRAAQSLGLECSVDLIYGTPGESVADWRESLEAALELGVSHVSCYALTIEPATALGRELRQGKITPVDPDDQAEKYEIADDLLSVAGLQWYEISNWARPGHECRHNLAYWHNLDYYGFGPGAHSHLRGEYCGRGQVPAGDFPGGGGRDCGRGQVSAEDFPLAGSRRFWNLKHPARWAAAIDAGRLPIEDGETVTGESLKLEDLLLGLRLREGLDLREYARKFGQAPHELELAARKLAVEGLVEPEKLPRAVLTRRGRLLADTVIQRLAGI